MKKRVFTSIVTFIIILLIYVPTGSAEDSLNDNVIKAAKEQIGVPYKYGGTTTSGFDCSGFVTYVFNQFDISLPRTAASQATAGTAVKKSELEAGDLVFFKTTSSSRISHSGIYIGDNKFISSTSSKGVKIDSLHDPYYWGSRYVSARRVLPEEEVKPARVLSAGEYHDVSISNWAYAATKSLTLQDIISGDGKGLFYPTNNVTRAEVAKMLSVAFNLTPTGTSTFTDVSEKHWAYDEIVATVEAGYFFGYEGNIFKPNQPITREEIASILSRAFTLQMQGDIIPFSDVSEDYWAYQDIQKLASNQITTGFPDNTFKAKNEASRAEFAQFLHKALQNK